MLASAAREVRELPDNLPFHVGDIIGTGAFATYKPCPRQAKRFWLIFSVRIARDLNSPQLYAVKFIDKIAALHGNDPKSRKGQSILFQIATEIALHRTCAEHRNVIGFVATMETPVWRWIAMEFAEGGDLFDKIGISIV